MSFYIGTNDPHSHRSRRPECCRLGRTPRALTSQHMAPHLSIFSNSGMMGFSHLLQQSWRVYTSCGVSSRPQPRNPHHRRDVVSYPLLVFSPLSSLIMFSFADCRHILSSAILTVARTRVSRAGISSPRKSVAFHKLANPSTSQSFHTQLCLGSHLLTPSSSERRPSAAMERTTRRPALPYTQWRSS